MVRRTWERSGQRPGVVGVCGTALGRAEVEQEPVDEIGCQLDAGPAGGLGDRQAEVTASHRADHDLGSLEHGHELGDGCGERVEVGAEPDRHEPRRRGIHDQADELLACLLRRVGEQLLELVDHHQQVLRGDLAGRTLQRRDRIGPGRHHGDRPVPRQRALPDRGDDAGAEHRGLAGARCADDDDRTALPDPLTEPSEDVGGHGVPAEEPSGVLGLVAVQPLVRRGLVGHPQRGRPAQSLERRHPGLVVIDAERIEDREERVEEGEVR